MIKDHLGNTRVLLHQNGTPSESTDYYPFGKEIFRSSPSSPQNNYKYNGKELQQELGLNQYDYGARFYYAEIGRWNVVDPLAEQGRRWSTYTYSFNNPQRFIDPDGMWAYDKKGNIFTDNAGEIASFVAELQGEQQNKRANDENEDDKKKKKNDSQNIISQAEKDKLHKKELEKYGQIITSYNLSFGGSLGAIGGTFETGIIFTDKGWARKYKTIYYSSGFASPSGALGFTVVSPKSDKYLPTFSDWEGAMVGFSASVDFISGNIGFTSTYWVSGLRLSAAPSSLSLPFMKDMKGSSGIMNMGLTTWIGVPYQVGKLNLPGASQRYINTMQY